jgi:hypothetical protein
MTSDLVAIVKLAPMRPSAGVEVPPPMRTLKVALKLPTVPPASRSSSTMLPYSESSAQVSTKCPSTIAGWSVPVGAASRLRVKPKGAGLLKSLVKLPAKAATPHNKPADRQVRSNGGFLISTITIG